MVVLFLVIVATFVIRINEKNTLRYAIVLVNKIDVLGSPDDQGTELFSLHEGVKFKVEELRGDWSKIRLADGKIGWVKRSVFEII
jgi:SH3-like domain-containing protein